jgi:hypothetical protein
MASVTMLTAARMLAIEAASIISGAVNGAGHLILTKYGGGTVDAGYVVGPPGPGATLASIPPSNPDVGQIYIDKNGLTGLTDLMAANNPATSTASWVAYAFGYDTGVTFAIAGGGCTLTWTTTGNHFAGLPIGGLSQGEQYLAVARVRVPAGSPDVKLTVGYRTSSQPVTMKDVDVTVMLQFTSDSTSLSWGIECGGATGSVIVKELKVYAVNQKGYPEFYWDGTSWVQMSHMAAKADIYSRVNTYGAQTVNGLKTFMDNLTAKGFILSVGNAGTTADAATVILNGADAGAGGGGGELRFTKNGANKWSLYTLGSGDGNLYVRDQANAKMVATFKPGGTDASQLEVTDLLTANRFLYTRSVDISGTNLNNLTQAGCYNGSSMTNAPDASWYYIEVLMHSNFSGATPTYMMQRATHLAAGTPIVYQRTMTGAGVWNSWFRVDAHGFHYPEAWQGVTFTNSWTDYGSGFQTCQFRRFGDMVQLRGLIKSGTIATSAFTLPVGYRPPATLILSGITNLAASHATGAASAGTAHTHAITSLANVAMRVDISTAGAVSIVSNASNGYYSLSGLEFSVS